MEISKKKAVKLLREDLHYYEDQVATRVNSPVTENEFSAMVCLTYNIGEGRFSESTVLREVNKAEYAKAADAILMWNKVSGAVNSHQVSRRKAERTLFLR